MNIKAIEFAAFFGYKLNHTPQGFTNIDSDFSKVKIAEEEKSENRKKTKMESGREVWPRDPKKAKQAIKQAEFKCEIDDTHETFVSGASRKNYMEAHHLIPLRMQHDFENSLDVVGNIVSICPNCHRLIHYGRDKDKKKSFRTSL